MKEAERALARPFDDCGEAIEVRSTDHEIAPTRIVSTAGHSDDLGLARWLTCLSRGHHDFDEEGLCRDCDAPRSAS